MRLLLISNSTMAGQPYLEYPMPYIKDFIGNQPIELLFIPYAGVTVKYDDYEAKVKAKFNEIGHEIVSIHHFSDPILAVQNAQAIVVGGGNTFALTHQLHELGLIDAIRNKVIEGTPFIGWSAGSNVACPSIRTTNDMPIIQPKSFNATSLIPFQINPHYLDAHPEGHGGETREDRILEFLEMNPKETVVGLREGCMFRIEGSQIQHIGEKSLRVFRHKTEPLELNSNEDFQFLLK